MKLRQPFIQHLDSLVVPGNGDSEETVVMYVAQGWFLFAIDAGLLGPAGTHCKSRLTTERTVDS